MTIDLDQERAARREARKEAPALTFGGRSFPLPVELSIEVAKKIGRLGKTKGAASDELLDDLMTELFGDQVEVLVGLGMSYNDLVAVLRGLPKEYAVPLGESQAPRRSSRSTSRRSKQTSSEPTG